jgi:molybdopterin-guanine dinucleotide biosynthesis protein A
LLGIPYIFSFHSPDIKLKKIGMIILNAIILAGSQPTENENIIKNKALIDICGKTMVEYVAQALKEAALVEKIIVVGSKEELFNSLSGKVDAIIDSNSDITDNILSGIEYFNALDDLLICSCDIPLLSPKAVDDFISRAKEMNVDFCYPIVEKSVNEKRFPGSKRTYVKLKDGTFTGGNIFFVNPTVISKTYVLTKNLIENRKNPLKMAKLLGFSFLVNLLSGKLTINKIENKVSRIFGITAKAIISNYPELANDVDKLDDISLMADYF